MKINWKVRLKNKTFWVAAISAVLILIQQILKIAGIDFDYTVISEQLIGIVGTIFTLLTIIGVVTDPTTSGLTDSEQALGYEEPKED